MPAGARVVVAAAPAEVRDQETRAAPQPRRDGRNERWASHREERRTELIDEARRAVHDLGPDASMEEIAARLGTSKSVLYRYFGEKTTLQAAIGDYVLGRARARLEEAARAQRDPRRSVGAMIETYLEIVSRSRNVFLFVNRPQQAASEGNLRTFVSQVDELVAEVLTPLVDPSTPPEQVATWATALVGAARAAADRWISTPEEARVPLDHLAADLTTLVWDGTHTLIATHRTKES